MNRKAQISVFVILGIVILLGVSIYLIQVTQFTDFDEESLITEVIPQEFAVIQQYVTQCIQTVGEEGIRLLGSQGGYINPQGVGLTANRFQPTQGDGVYLSSLSEQFIPFWYHLVTDNRCDGDCFFGSNYPVLDGAPGSIREQLEDYVNVELYSCLDRFQPLVDSGYTITSQDLAQTRVYFRDNDVRFYVEYPIVASTGDLEQFISQFEYVADVPFLRIFEFASLLFEIQTENNYVENVILHGISSYTGTTSDSIPPFFASTTNPVETVFWLTPSVKETVSDILLRHINDVQVGFFASESEYEQVTFPQGKPDSILMRLRGIQTIPLITSDARFQNRFTQFDVDFRYQPDWDFFFQLNNGQQIIRPSSIGLSFIPFMAINEFRTNYDVSVPFTIAIHDDEAFSMSGFSFVFASEANIRNNLPMEAEFQRDTSILDIIAQSQEAGTDSTLFCDINQRNSGPITMVFEDAKTQQPISDVLVTASCGIDSCFVATSDSQGLLSSQFPICLGGLLQFKHPEYAQSATFFDATAGEYQDFGVIELQPFRTVNVGVEKKMMIPFMQTFSTGRIEREALQWRLSDETQHLDQYEVAIITFTQVNVPFGVEPHTATVSLSGQDTIHNLRNITLIPGEYEVEGSVFTTRELSIPEQNRSVRSGLFSTERFTIPQVDLDTWVSAQTIFTQDTQFITITADELDSATELVIFASGYDFVELELLRRELVVEDLEFMDLSLEIFTEHIAQLQPQFR